MLEKWIKWEPIEFSKGNYELIKIIQNYNGTFIEIDDETNTIEIMFNGCIIALRACDEGRRYRAVINMQEIYQDEYYFVGWPFYISENSDFAKWIEQENYGMVSKEEIKHFVIVTANDVIDVLSTFYPTVKILKNKN